MNYARGNKKNKTNEHYYTKKPRSKLLNKEVTVNLFNINLRFITPSGVFCFGKVDSGSLLLIKKALIPKNAKVLDLGSGYGLIGITLAKVRDDVKIVMTDINERAVTFCEKNVIINGLKNKLENGTIKIVQGNLYEQFNNKPDDDSNNVACNNKFDVILSNPPTHAGRKICFKIIEEAKDYLNTDGVLEIVARHSKGGKMLMEKMQEVFGNVETLGKKGGFRVYMSRL